MFFLKKKMPESLVSEQYVEQTIKLVNKEGPVFFKYLQEQFPDDFIIENAGSANLEFATAVFAEDLASLSKIFEMDQSKRLSKLIMAHIFIRPGGEYVNQEIAEYSYFSNMCQALPNKYGDPLYSYTNRLIQKLTGKNYEKVFVQIGDNRSGIMNQRLVLAVAQTQLFFLGKWSLFKKEFNIVKS